MNRRTVSSLGIALALAAGTMGNVFAGPVSPTPAQGMRSIVDMIAFGNPASEQAHNLDASNSDVIQGGLGEPARLLLPATPVGWEGGAVSFVMKVDPVQPNYFTIRLWGDENSSNRLILFCEGKQIGYRNEGDVDILDPGVEDRPFNGRFYYNTCPLPTKMTSGKTSLHFEIRSSGRIWPYGMTFDQFQHPMTTPTPGMYCVYTHTDGCFIPPADEKQGDAPTNPPVRQEPGPEVFDQLKARVNREVDLQLNRDKPTIQPLMQFLASAYFVKWTPAYHNPMAITQVLKTLDSLFVAYRKNPKLAESDPATYNPDWFGLGPSGYTIFLLARELQPYLDEPIDDGAGGMITRRAAYCEMLVASRDWHRQNRRQYTNQSMINDLYGIYLSNRGVEVLDPAKAMPEPAVRRYLYESVGLQPWLGSDTKNGPEKPLGDDYWQVTQKGLTRELGYVGYYGEVLDWVTMIYDATRPTPGQPGDPKIRAQLIKMARARAIFRRPALDAAGNRAMRIETVVGWRDELHYPGDVAYGQRAAWDASTIQSAAATQDPELVAYARQMFADNQFFASVQRQMKETQFRVTAGLLDTPDEYALIMALPAPQKKAGSASTQLPMSPGQPDFAWADEQDGVVAVKHGSQVLYASLYWRAHFAINFLARVHYSTPTIDRIAVVREDATFEPSGYTYKRNDDVNTPFAPWLPNYPPDIHSALAGEAQPIPKFPAGVPFHPGERSPYAGKAEFYTLRYGPYLIGMNMTTNKTFDLKVPAGVRRAPNLVTDKVLSLNAPVRVGPQSTVVLYLG